MKYFFVLTFLLVAELSHAQMKGFSIGPYAEFGIPTGSLQQTHNNGLGAGFGADIRLGKLGITGSAGYMHFPGRKVHPGDGSLKTPALSVVPIRAGLKYKLAPALYAKLETGMAKFTGENESALIIAPGIAVRLLGLELQAKYEIWNRKESLSFWGLKAGINF